MYQYKSRARNLDRRNRDIIADFNATPRTCPHTGLRYDINSLYELLAERYYLSPHQIERIVSLRKPTKKAAL